MSRQETTARRISRTAFAAALPILALSWAVLFAAVALATLSLAPYDTSWYDHWGWPADSPLPGSWQRSLSAFFEKPPGSVLPAAFVVGASIACFAAASRRAGDQTDIRLELAWCFAATNLIASLAVFFDSLAVDWPLEIGPAPGYDWTIQFLVPDGLLLATLFALQVWGIPWLMRIRFSGLPADTG